jgi:hypothetical protein
VHNPAVLLAEQRMMPRFRLAHIWLIGEVADDRIWLHRSAALPAALTDGFKCAFTVAGVLCAAGASLALLLLPRKRAAENEQAETMALSGPVLGNGCNLKDRAWGGINSPACNQQRCNRSSWIEHWMALRCGSGSWQAPRVC